MAEHLMVQKHVAQNEAYACQMRCPRCQEVRAQAAGSRPQQPANQGQQRAMEVAVAGDGGGVVARLRSGGRNDLGAFSLGATSGSDQVGE
jgi:hypothetical protein